MSSTAVFSVQDANGRVSQVSLSDPLAELPLVGDLGAFIQDNDTPQYPFVVTQVIDNQTFSVTFSTDEDAMAVSKFILEFGLVWLSPAANSGAVNVAQYDAANAYITTDQFKQYHNSRGNSYADSPVEAIQFAIVKATDYLNQKYTYKGIKKVQSLGNAILDPNLAINDPFLFPTYGIGVVPFLAPSTTCQVTEWPRQGVVDNNGDTITGLPVPLLAAACELALRSLNGVDLQPDFDDTVVKNGAILQSYSEEVGPIRVSYTYDTERGLGFFASFPHIDRMLTKAGLLSSGGGRRVTR